ncbi:MAG: DNA cytosine methyltransferase, partial [Lentisphaeria bacterium]
MRYASVCSGVDAATLAWMPLDWKPVFYSEIEPFPCAVLKHHYPETPNLGDMTKINGKDYHGKVDLLVGGTPCQSYSVAGLRKGLADPRGQLSLVFTRLAYEMGVQWTVWENVPGVLSQDNGGAFSAILSSLAGCVITTPREGWSSTGFIRNFRRDRFGLAWRVLDAQYVRVDGFRHAVPQRRLRLFVVGYFGDWRRAAAVLFEPQMLLGDTAPERKTREEVAGGFNESITGADNEGGRNTVCLSSGNSNMGIMENVCPVIAASPDRKRLRCVIDMRQLEVAEEEISPTLVATDYKGGKAVCEET